MRDNQEEVFHFGGEGGGVSIFKTLNSFIFNHSECYLDDNEDLQFTTKRETYDTFEEAFKQINDHYPWYTMVVEVSDEYKTYVLDQIQFNPNMEGKSTIEIEATKKRTNDKFTERESLWDLLNDD